MRNHPRKRRYRQRKWLCKMPTDWEKTILRAVSIAAGLLFLTAGGVSQAAGVPICAPPIEVANAAVMRVEPNGVVILTDGRAIRLEGILLPGGARDHAPSFLADQAINQLNDLVRGQTVTLAARPPKEDRYGRVRAQIFFDGSNGENWLQVAMLRRGLARVYITPDRRECAKELYAAEHEARAKGAGIWSQTGYEMRNAANVSLSDLGTFQIVEGRVTTAEVRGSRAYLNFGVDWRTDFTATISPEDLKTFRAVNIDPAGYAGKTLRVRGVVERLNGPEIEIAAPEQIEEVAAPPLRPSQH